MGLEQAGTLNITAITSSYWPANESKIDGWGRVKAASPKRRPDNRPAWGTSKGPWDIPTPNRSSGCDWENATHRLVTHRQLRQHLPTATASTYCTKTAQLHATATVSKFRCATECKSRYLYDIWIKIVQTNHGRKKIKKPKHGYSSLSCTARRRILQWQ